MPTSPDSPFTPRWKAVLDKHRRHVELSPGAGKDAQNYALAVIADIEADFVHDSPRSETAPPEQTRLEVKPDALDWKSAAMRYGESIQATGPRGYYDFTPDQWLAWAMSARTETATHKKWEPALKQCPYNGWPYAEREAWKAGYYNAMLDYQEAMK